MGIPELEVVQNSVYCYCDVSLVYCLECSQPFRQTQFLPSVGSEMNTVQGALAGMEHNHRSAVAVAMRQTLWCIHKGSTASERETSPMYTPVGVHCLADTP